MLRNTMTSERPLSDTLPHPRGSSLSRRIHEEEEDEERGGIRQKEMENREKSGKEETKKIVQTNVWSLLHSLSCLSAFYFLSLSLSLSLFFLLPSFPLHPPLFLSLISLYLSQARMSACPTDEFIFVHAFRLHRQEIYARIAVRGKLLSAAGIIHTSRSLDEKLTTGDALLSRLNA